MNTDLGSTTNPANTSGISLASCAEQFLAGSSHLEHSRSCRGWHRQQQTGIAGERHRERQPCSSGNGLGTCWRWREMGGAQWHSSKALWGSTRCVSMMMMRAAHCYLQAEAPVTVTSLDLHTCFGIVRVVFKLKITFFFEILFIVFFILFWFPLIWG